MMNNTTRNEAISFDSLYMAYEDCRRNKGGTESALAFEMHYERNLVQLRDEINAGLYEPKESITFIVEKPVKREVFAANFRDRIVHHWIAQRIEPLLEAQFIDTSFNCRKGKGTLAAVKYLRDAIRAKSENYTRDCWVLKYDLKGFFMSINRAMVTDKLCRFIRERYHGDDIETLIYLTQKILLNAPEKNCIVKGHKSDWNGLAKDKSLFTVPDGYGLPIGNLTSQLIANFLLDETDHYLKDTLGLTIDRYVDDTATIDTDHDKMLMAMPLIREHLWQTAGARVHPHKFYMQHYTKGMKFLGMVVKRDRIYVANRTLGQAMNKMHHFNAAATANGRTYCLKHAEDFVASVNSYLGLMRQGTEYSMRRAFCSLICEEWLKYVSIQWDFNKIILKHKYKYRERVKRMLQRKRKKARINKYIKAKRMTARIYSVAESLPTVEQFNHGRKRGCIVRWDFERVKTMLPDRKERGKGKRNRTAQTEAVSETITEPQGEMVDSNIIAYSEMRYLEIPDAETVVSDIEFDMKLRYPDEGTRPTIDLDSYRTAIENLK